MGIFDGYLFCSDIDGTLVLGTEVSQENLDALRYFTSEGGHFVIATGRSPQYAHETLGIVPHAPIIALNGTLVTSETYLPLFSYPLSADILRSIRALPANGQQSLSCASLVWTDHADFYSSPEEYCDAIDTALATGDLPCKIVFTLHEAAQADAFCALGVHLTGKDATFYRTWDTGVELYRADAGKGACMQRLRQMLPGITRTVAVGDYQNDISMIQAADLGFAVENALPETRRAARYRAPDCRHHAIAYIVEQLKKEAVRSH